MNILVHGSDRLGWAIDQNRNNLISALKRQQYTLTWNPFNADIVHNVSWNLILLSDIYTRIIRRHPRIIVTTSNFIDPTNNNFLLTKEFHTVAKFAKGWITFSSKQKKILEEYGLLCFQMPNYIDLSLFYPRPDKILKNDLYKKYQIPLCVHQGRVIIGSFQRDSLGTDLNQPKWQKNPDLLINILEKCDRKKYLLLLAGPRRHYIINQCKKKKIPFWYIGKETALDDIKINNLPINSMAELYWMCDLYIVTSESEGGPQSIIESTLTKTMIFSTDVGIARDFLDTSQIIDNQSHFQKVLEYFIQNLDNRLSYSNLLSLNHDQALKILDYKSMDDKLIKIYRKILMESS